MVLNGRKTTIAEAEAVVGYAIPLPGTSVADRARFRPHEQAPSG
jgi:hypothetical protein